MWYPEPYATCISQNQMISYTSECFEKQWKKNLVCVNFWLVEKKNNNNNVLKNFKSPYLLVLLYYYYYYPLKVLNDWLKEKKKRKTKRGTIWQNEEDNCNLRSRFDHHTLVNWIRIMKIMKFYSSTFKRSTCVVRIKV